MTRKEAVDLLFSYYVAEQFYEEQFATADDLAAELLSFAVRGWPKVEEMVMGNLDYDLTFGKDVPDSDDQVRETMLGAVNGHEKATQLVEAAVLVWCEKGD